jgi:small conductance mechanosensitive channel
MRIRRLFAVLLLACLLVCTGQPRPAAAQGGDTGELIETVVPDDIEGELDVPDRVDVQPTARDEDIASRLQGILESTGWFRNPQVSVREGVVFLEGSTEEPEYKDWAGQLAGKTQDVVAVVNRIQIVEPPAWDLTPILDEVNRLARSFILALPRILFGLLVLIAAWFAAVWIHRLARRLLKGSLTSPLLRDVAAWLIAVPVFLVGIYLVLQFFGLTRLALTVLGGTGLAGLIVGIAFSDIVENFLASILISVRTPFQSGDFIKVQDLKGIVQRVTTRGTLLMGIDGNHIQIPNSVIYKSTIINYTANPNRRIDFAVGIGYEDAVAAAQDLILAILTDHPAVLERPEPLVLADNLGMSSVDLRVYFWIDASTHDIFKVKSSVLRLTKAALMSHGFTLPDAAREVVFPQGVPVLTAEEQRALPPAGGRATPSPAPEEPEMISTAAEDRLDSEDEKIREQARNARVPEEGRDLLDKGAAARRARPG